LRVEPFADSVPMPTDRIDGDKQAKYGQHKQNPDH